jgi:serine/threonine protein kinase
LREKKVSKQSDIYAFGMTCIEVITRKQPFPKLLPTEVATGVVSGKLKAEIPNECPSSFKETLNKCVSFEASERPSTNAIISSFK